MTTNEWLITLLVCFVVVAVIGLVTYVATGDSGVFCIGLAGSGFTAIYVGIRQLFNLPD